MPDRKQRNIAVVTGSRAEFGLLTSTLRAMQAHRDASLRTIVAGLHLVSGSWRDVVKAGFTIDAKVRMQRKGQSGRSADVQALSRGIAGFGKAFNELQPSIVVVLGDRIEAFAAAAAASVGGIHVAHIHGGDRAEGVADEAMRHAVSKLAHLHLAATEQSRQRLIHMGERDDLVFNMGSPAVDGLKDVEPVEDGPNVLVMQHPIGAADEQERKWMAATLKATASMGRMVFEPNHDSGHAGVRAALDDLTEPVVEHLPRDMFLRVLAGSGVIVGNSSAGLIEAAVLGVPCVNIGPRQAGREKPGNVIDCEYGVKSVKQVIAQAIAIDRSSITHPYGPGGTGNAIAELLASIELSDVPLRKRNAY